MTKRATVEGTNHTETMALEAQAERLASMIPVYRAEHLEGVEGALRSLTETEDELAEVRARLAKRRAAKGRGGGE